MILSFIKKHAVLITLILILTAAFVLRFAALDHPLSTNGGEGFRDLLAAKHALLYGEWPLNGHSNGLSTIQNSPLYYYIITFFAFLVGPTFFSVGILFIVFECLFVALVFLFTRALFGNASALIAALILGISPHYVVEVAGFFIWPPYFAAPFIILSLYSLWYGFEHNKKNYISVSPLLMLLGLAVHQSTIAIIPLYAFLALYAAYRRSFSFRRYVFSALAFVTLALILFLPSVWSTLSTYPGTIEWGTRVVREGPAVTLLDGIHRTRVSIPYAFGAHPNTKHDLEVALVLLLVLAVWFFYRSDISRKKKIYVVIAFLFLVSEILAATFFDPEGIPRHFEPVLWMVPMLFGVFVAVPPKQPFVMSIVSFIVILFFIYSPLTDHRFQRVYANIGPFERPHYQIMDHATDAMVNEIERLRLENSFDGYRFFNISTLGDTNFTLSPLVMWFPLEDKLGTELEEAETPNLNHTEITHYSYYLFYVCFKHTSTYTPEQCLIDQSAKYPNHEFIGTVFSSDAVTIYLARQKNFVPKK